MYDYVYVVYMQKFRSEHLAVSVCLSVRVCVCLCAVCVCVRAAVQVSHGVVFPGLSGFMLETRQCPRSPNRWRWHLV